LAERPTPTTRQVSSRGPPPQLLRDRDNLSDATEHFTVTGNISVEHFSSARGRFSETRRLGGVQVSPIILGWVRRQPSVDAPSASCRCDDPLGYGLTDIRRAPLAQHQPTARLPRRPTARRVRSHVLRYETDRPTPGRNPMARASIRTRTRAIQTSQAASATPDDMTTVAISEIQFIGTEGLRPT
jgi:hypothetical protein